MTYHLFRVGKIWHYRFQLDGVRVQQSTRETDRPLAEKVAARAFREAKLWERDGKVIPTLRELVAERLKPPQARRIGGESRASDVCTCQTSRTCCLTRS